MRNGTSKAYCSSARTPRRGRANDRPVARRDDAVVAVSGDQVQGRYMAKLGLASRGERTTPGQPAAGLTDRRLFSEGAGKRRVVTGRSQGGVVRFVNWSGSLAFTASEQSEPVTEDEVCDLVQRARESGMSVRPVGSGHSSSLSCGRTGYC